MFSKSFTKFCQNSAHSFNFRNAVKVNTNNDINLQFEKLIYPEMCDIFTYISFLFHLQRAAELWSWTVKLESFQFHSILKMQMRQVLKSATQLLLADFNLRNGIFTRMLTETKDLLKTCIGVAKIFRPVTSLFSSETRKYANKLLFIIAAACYVCKIIIFTS